MKVKKCLLLFFLFIFTVYCFAQNDSIIKANSTRFKIAVFKKDFLNSKIDVTTSPVYPNDKGIYRQDRYQYSVVFNTIYKKSWVSENDYNEYPRYSQTRYNPNAPLNYPFANNSTNQWTNPTIFSSDNAWGEFIAYTLYQILNKK